MPGAVTIQPSDLQRFASNLDDDTANAVISGVIARAAVFAPCIISAEFVHTAAAADILIEVCLRRLDGGSGSLTTRSQTVGPHQLTEAVDTRQKGRAGFQPEDITDLQDMCRAATGEASSAAPSPSGSFPDSPTEDPVYASLWPK